MLERLVEQRLPRPIAKNSADPAYRKKAVELMAEMHKGGPWFWKDPALSIFLLFWKQIWTMRFI